MTFALTIDDYRALQMHICRPIKRLPVLQHLLVGLPSGIMLGVAIKFLPSPRSFFVGFLGAFILILAVSHLASRRARAVTDPVPNGSILCSHEYWLEDDGLRCRTPGWHGVTRWSAIFRVDETDQHLFVMIDRAAAYTLPKRAFASPADAARFAELVRARLTAR
ncbi:MAG TPA: YcxB family protein [Polyangiaceae bacterium]